MSVASNNLFALLGNDDGDETPRPPVKTVDKTSTRTTKRNAEPEAPARLPAGGAPTRRGGASGNEAAFRDRNVGSDRNRNRGTDENARGGARGGYGARGRGGRGGRFPRDRDDRHSRGPPGGNSDKQAAHGWGATEGNAELKDEQAGEAIAEGEKKDAGEDAADKEPEEPEEKVVSYSDYLAQQAEKKLALNSGLEVRKANDGGDKWGDSKEVQKGDDDEYIAPSAGKAKRERERKQKQVVEIDQRYVEPERPARGGARGGRGDRGDRGGPRGGGRGDARGGGRGGDRGRGGNPRGGRGGSAPINTKDENAFPSLGGK